MTTVLPVMAVAAAVAAVAWWLRRRAGTAHSSDVRFGAAELLAVGLRPGVPAIVVFTAPSCATCTPARQVIDDIATRHAIPVARVDVADHESLAWDKRVLRVPTSFVLDHRGGAVARFLGVPRPADLAAVLPDSPVAA